MPAVTSFVSQHWLSICGVGGLVVGAAGIVVALVLHRQARSQRMPRYLTHSIALLGSDSVLSPEVTVQHRGQDLPQVTMTRVALWNAGRAAIRYEDVPQGGALRIRFPNPVQVVRASVRSRTDELNKLSVHASPFPAPSQELLLRFAYLDAGDGGLIEVVHTGPVSQDVSVAGKIIECPDGVVRDGAASDPSALFRPPEWKGWFRSLPRGMLLSVVAMSVVACGVAVSAVGQTAGSMEGGAAPREVLLGVALKLVGAIMAGGLTGLLVLMWANRRRMLLASGSCPQELLVGIGGGAPALGPAPVAELGAEDVLCSGVGDGEEFEDTDGSRKLAVVLARRAVWRAVTGAEYVWARELPTAEEAKEGCTVTLVRSFELPARPSAATLFLRVDDEADVVVNGHAVAAGLVGYTQEDPHVVEVGSHLGQGYNELRITVRNRPMDLENIRPELNPSGVAYRLEVTY